MTDTVTATLTETLSDARPANVISAEELLTALKRGDDVQPHA